VQEPAFLAETVGDWKTVADWSTMVDS